MAARGDNNIRRWYNYTGGEVVPRDITHVTIDGFIPYGAFEEHPNVEEVYLHAKFKKIGSAFDCCPSLRRVIMPGVEVVEDEAFYSVKL
mmetsp:Transcript_4901/g.8389  ORF Transcript_4901/g.8389 Transcript_4901/m.8389 type:complete len:89 (-) Transcript_4901:304-570(-)